VRGARPKKDDPGSARPRDRKGDEMKTRKEIRWKRFSGAVGIATGLAVAVAAAPAVGVRFHDTQKQTAEFIAADGSIALSPAQQRVMTEALSTMPAPCCSDYSMATCCCPCNLAKSAWGLSKILIAKHHQNAAQVRKAVSGWVRFVNPRGFSGDACFSDGGCNRAFNRNGCGGMKETELAATL